MPLFHRADPTLEELIAYLVARSRDREVTLNQTKLVKLLYLVDVERVRRRLRPLTGLTWRFFHFGPYALELPETLDRMEGRTIYTGRWHGSTLYRGARDAPEGDEWPPATRRLVDGVIQRFAPMDLHELLDYVYFRTGPMADAHRGDLLDLERAREWDEPRQLPPLAAPAAPTDVSERLAAWRSRTARHLAPVDLDPPGLRFDDPDEDLGGGVEGEVTVPEDTVL